MQKTLGGDRLGSGNKQKVYLHGYERSTHDLGYLWRSTISAGTLVPFLCEVGLPGDTWDINLGLAMNTHPTIGPLFGSYKAQLDCFVAPIRLYNSLLHNNALGIGLNMSQVKLPTITVTALPDTMSSEDLDNSQINPSCILAYLGIRGAGNNEEITPIGRTFNGTALLAVWDIYKQYYSNKQEEIGAVIHTPAEALINTITVIQISQPPYTSTQTIPDEGDPEANIITFNGAQIKITFAGTQPLAEQIYLDTTEHGIIQLSTILAGPLILDTPTTLIGYINAGTIHIKNWQYANGTQLNSGTPQITTFPLTNIDDMRKAILKHDSTTTPFDITAQDIEPYSLVTAQENGIPAALSSQEGLPLKTYQSDLFNNWLQTEWIDGPNGINEITAIDTSGGSFTIDTLILSKKVYNMLNRIAVSGGTYDDWLEVVYDHTPYGRCESPMYIGGLIKELVFQEVVSNSASQTDNGTQELGTLAGKGTLAQKHKGGNITAKIDEPSYIIGFISLTPRIDYSQGNRWDVNLQTLDDLHKPPLDELGFQEDITEYRAWWDTKYNPTTLTWEQKSAGKQPAWLHYMTNYNRIFGNFAIGNNKKVGEMFMTLNRRYEQEGGTIKDLTTYIDPSKYNFIFAETALDAQNFWAQIAVDITARRKMSAKLMPNL